MSKINIYRETLRALDPWEPYLLQESGLPGPRGNIELAQAVADEGDAALFAHFLTFDAQKAPVNSPYEFLAFCGTIGLGKLLAEGDRSVLPTLRGCASDPRWRTREAVAMALQRWGRVAMDALLEEMALWAKGNPYEQRAAVAGICEPALLRAAAQVAQVLRILDDVTTSIAQVADRRSDAFVALRKGLGFCWSIAVCALPEAGKPLMERWLASDDKDIRWIMKENLKKARLERMDAAWAAKMQARQEKKMSAKNLELTFEEITSETDIPELTAVMTRAFDDDSRKHLGQERGGPDGYDNGDFFRKWLFGYKESIGYKILAEGKIIGAFIVWIMPDHENFLGTIFVDPACQDCGVGIRAWQFIETTYPEAHSWQLETPAFAKKNHYFYEKKCGFTKMGEKDDSFLYRKVMAQ